MSFCRCVAGHIHQLALHDTATNAQAFTMFGAWVPLGIVVPIIGRLETRANT
jgi:UDP-2,3-diacylglucosamine pyrophosphatase LpxH